MTTEIAEMYAQLTPEGRRKVDAKIDELLQQQARKENRNETPSRS